MALSLSFSKIVSVGSRSRTPIQSNFSLQSQSYVFVSSSEQIAGLAFVPFKPGTIVVNAGDLLARWSNDILRSTLHRVVAPPAESANADGMTPLRQSIAFFCNPNGGARISCLPNCHWPGHEAKYGAITTEEYIVGRLASTIVDY
jgi:isopenicillin N synthase-like dioxygenase